MPFLFTSESVTGGHPDKLADQISDAVLDAYVAKDPRARVAIETYVTNGLCIVGGEVRVRPGAHVDVAAVARAAIRDAGYADPACGFPADDVAVMTIVGEQSPDIAMGVDRGDEALQGAGDQGLMFGYACRDTPELMPLPIHLAHRLARGLMRLRTDGTLPYLLPDGKTQVTVEYGDDGRPRRLDTVVVSTQHRKDVRDPRRIRADLERHLFPEALAPWKIDENTRVHVNPTGAFLIGGPKGDTGLTGRKIIVDTYGGWAPHGGGAFSGKDPSKVDRSAAYVARYIAKNVVASGLVDACEVQLAYVIGVAEPASLRVRGEGWGREVPPDEVLVGAVREVFRLTPAAIIRELDLLRPIYRPTAVGGHFGREEPTFTWERTDKAEALAEAARGSTWAARR
jgi:S-adenosylmethionine synthetase